MYYMYELIYTAHTAHIGSAWALFGHYVCICFPSMIKRNFKQVVVISDIRLMLCLYHSWENSDLFILGLGLVNYRTNIDGFVMSCFGQFELFLHGYQHFSITSDLWLSKSVDIYTFLYICVCVCERVHVFEWVCIGNMVSHHLTTIFQSNGKCFFSFKLMSEHAWYYVPN